MTARTAHDLRDSFTDGCSINPVPSREWPASGSHYFANLATSTTAERNRPVFDEVQGSSFLELSRKDSFPVGSEIGQAIIGVSAQVSGGLELDEVFRCRGSAWAETKRRLGQ